MKIVLKTLLACGVVSALILNAGTASGQLVNDGVTATLNGTSSILFNNLIVGTNAANTMLVLTNGASVSNAFGYIGLNASSSNNSVFVTGTNSAWTNGGNNLMVGEQGSSNQLVIVEGGTVAVAGTSLVGNFGNSSNNLVLVRGPGSTLHHGGSALIGFNGSGNTMFITGGGAVNDSFPGYVGYNSGANFNQVIVSGTNSVWNSGSIGSVAIGYSGLGNTLLITNGGSVIGNGSYVGLNSSARSNQAIVAGPNSSWINGGGSSLTIGNQSSGNRLIISDGATVSNALCTLGNFLGGSNNQIIVSGSNSILFCSAALNIGSSASGNTLLITNGGAVTVNNTSGTIGVNATANSNQVIVTGTNSVWNNSTCTVGGSGSGNTLLITGGASSSARSFFVGQNASSSNNLITLSQGTLIVTNAGGTGRLDIRRGSFVCHDGAIDAKILLLTNSTGSFIFHAGTLRIGQVTVTNDQLFAVGDGFGVANCQLTGAGIHIFTRGLLINPNGLLSGNGQIVGDVTNYGTISVGNSAGALTVSGSLSLKSSSVLTFEIGGLVPTNQFDQMTVTNLVEFAGTLNLAFLSNYFPRATDSFKLINYGTFSGAFANAPNGGRLSFANNLASFRVIYTSTALVLDDVQYVDTDHDGQGDLQEQVAGTNPNDAASVLKLISITQDDDCNYLLRFNGVAGKSYRIETSTNLVTWTTNNAPPLTNTATGVQSWYDDGFFTGGLPATRFYRVRLVLP